MSARAFSVVEFIVIIAMIGLVIAVGAPAFLRHTAINDARQCQENLSRIEGAVEAYALKETLTNRTGLHVNDLLATTGTGLLAEIPRCPTGGTYSLTAGHATCSIGDNKPASYAPHIYSTELPYVTK